MGWTDKWINKWSFLLWSITFCWSLPEPSNP